MEQELQKSGLKEASRSTAEMVVLCKQHDDAVESLKSAKQQSKVWLRFFNDGDRCLGFLL